MLKAWEKCGHDNAKPFASQDHQTGTYSYILTTYDEIWARALGRYFPTGTRHLYELIHEGSSVHLYIDFEFDPTLNPNRNPDAMVDALLEVIARLLYDTYDAQIDEGGIVELDASWSGKISRHIVVHLKDCVFSDNSYHLKWFMNKKGPMEDFFATLVCNTNDEARQLECPRMALPFRSPSSRPNYQHEDSTATYRELSEYVKAVASQNGRQAFIRAMKVYNGIISYEIAGNHYCANIGREHTRNNVYYVADLRSEECTLTQKCHDSYSCDGYRSPPLHIPHAIAKVTREHLQKANDGAYAGLLFVFEG
ncbi:hypothetical protein KFL_006790060 [Klebsormidium nitens]|uniref:DNA-directed primase/polymerase protein n=1 Tax=Klebsormidium nitens TaxID=105231 RepID=A0A1Y1IJ59_KLENI|nr:hypothetical protein KFL_006790060 [Klebsormidium nitens]|eukprot:GAQ90743.1 hypothetical protein KFL_006790060 [Klebsormidium nitens]